MATLAVTTICTQCVHLLNLEPGSVREHVWYNHLCKAVPLPTHIDPYNGKEITNSGNKFQYCHEVNRGDCPYFSRRK